MKEWIYGRNAVLETLRANKRRAYRLRTAEGLQASPRFQQALALARSRNLPLEEVARRELEGLGANHQGVALQVDEYEYSDLWEMLEKAKNSSSAPFFLLLDTLQDPQNLGTLLRTAEAVGVHGVVLPQRRTATVTPAVVNASSGACEHLLIAQHNLAQAIEELKQANIWVIGLDGGPQAQPVGQVRLDGALAVVVGSEGEGMRRLVRESCDVLMRLPMRGQVESLNASVAGSIALYLAWQARGFA
ncbi:MAG: 23S rRNA (guanosine(2251)-2'-O)-methyltransferase RlmB [Anaerolineales bacterium]